MLSVPKTIPKSLISSAAGSLLLLIPLLLPAETTEIGVINVGALNVRAQPDPRATIIGVLQRGTRVPILAQEKGWLRVSHRGKVGYIRGREEYVRVPPDKEPLGPPGLAGETGSEIGPLTDLEHYKARADTIHRKIKASKAEVLSFTRKEAQVIDNLNRNDLSLDNTRRQMRSLKAESTELEGLIRQTEKAAGTLSADAKATEDYASRRIVALYKLSWLGRTQVLASSESFYDVLRRQRALESILASDEEVLDDLWEHKTRLQTMLEKQADQISKKRALEAQLEDQARKLSRKKEERSRLLARIREQKSLEMAAIDAWSRSAAALDEKIRSLTVAREAPVFVVAKEPGDAKPQKPFSLLKGLLNMPVRGKVIGYFGSYTNREFRVTNFRSGIDIRSERGDPIRAVSGGKILFASWFKGYGNMIIIDHGEHYYTVYAHIEEIFRSKDDVVEMGEVVATVGDTGSRAGSKLHFEIRHHGKPIDPLLWIRKG